MPSNKISELQAATALTGSEGIPILQNGQVRLMHPYSFFEYLQSNPQPPPAEPEPQPSSVRIGSISFPIFNRMFDGHGANIAFPNTNFTANGDLLASDAVGGFFAAIEIPWERMDQNRAYQLLGNYSNSNGAPTTSGNAFQALLFGGNYVQAFRRNVLHIRFFDQSQLDFEVTLDPDVHKQILFAITSDGSDNFQMRVFTPGGSMLAGTSQSVSGYAYNSLRGSHVLLGDAWDDADEDTQLAFSSQTKASWPGSVYCHGFIHGSQGTDAEWQSIIEGAAIEASLSGVTAFTWARDYRGVSDLAAALSASFTGDTTSSGVVDGEIGNGTSARQTSAKFLTFGRLPDGYVADVKANAATGRVPLRGGQSAGLTGNLFARVLHPTTDALLAGPVAAGTIADIANASFDCPPFQGWGIIEVWADSDRETVFRMGSLFGCGQKAGVIGQSPIHYAMNYNGLAIPHAGTTSFAFKGEHRPQIYPLISAMDTMHNGVKGFAERIHEALGDRAVCVVDCSVNGTGPDQWTDDSNSARDWADDEAQAALSGTDKQPVCNWLQNIVGQNQADVFDGLVFGTGPNAADHFVRDGTVFDADYSFALSPPFRDTDGGANTDFDFDNGGNGRAAAVASQLAWAQVNSANVSVGCYSPDIAIDNDIGAQSPSGNVDLSGPHPSLWEKEGGWRIGYRLAEAVLRAKEVSSLVDPSIASWAINGARDIVTATVSLPNSGATLRTASGAPSGFEFSEDGGTTWSRTGFVAAIAGSTVTLTKTSGSWAAGVQWRFAPSGPYSFGTLNELGKPYDGHLYDGVTLETGLGTPVAPVLSPMVLA